MRNRVVVTGVGAVNPMGHSVEEVWSGLKEPAELYWEQLNDAGLTMAPLEQG